MPLYMDYSEDNCNVTCYQVQTISKSLLVLQTGKNVKFLKHALSLMIFKIMNAMVCNDMYHKAKKYAPMQCVILNTEHCQLLMIFSTMAVLEVEVVSLVGLRILPTLAADDFLTMTTFDNDVF